MSEHITESGRTIKFKLQDKRGALDSLVRMMGWYAPAKVDVRQRVVVNFTIGEGYDEPREGLSGPNGIAEMQIGGPNEPV